MEFPILEQLKKQFAPLSANIDQFVVYYNQKLWHELSQTILKFIFHPEVKGHLPFQFYTEFGKKFSRNIDQINHLKIIKESLANVEPEKAIQFLANFEQKQAYTDQIKTIAAGLRANYYVTLKNFDECSQLYHRIQKYLKNQKEVDSFVYSTFYKFAMNYFFEKEKPKHFYEHALQYLAYTAEEQIAEKQKIQSLANMGIALLTSAHIYNFSQLMEQPMLKSLGESEYRWIYEMLIIFNKGDIETYDKVIDNATQRNDKLKHAKNVLDTKIRLMAFLETAFNLPKNNRVLSFSQLSDICAIPLQHVEYMLIKAASLDLVRLQINQINKEVTVNWVKPKVLSNERIGVMLGKFQEWQKGTDDIRNYITDNRNKRVAA